jgi:hypothetical protein
MTTAIMVLRLLLSLVTGGVIKPTPTTPPWVRTLLAVAVASAIAALEVLKNVPVATSGP